MNDDGRPKWVQDFTDFASCVFVVTFALTVTLLYVLLPLAVVVGLVWFGWWLRGAS